MISGMWQRDERPVRQAPPAAGEPPASEASPPAQAPPGRVPVAEVQSHAGDGDRRHRGRRAWDSPVTSWQWWLGPAGLVIALVFAVLASLVVEIPAALAGVHFTSGKTPGGIELLDTVLQDGIFVVTAVLLARSGGRAVRSWQFGLRPTKLSRALGYLLLMMLAFYLLSLLWGEVIQNHTKEKLLEMLGANEATSLLAGSALLTCVIAPICEELLFRGFIFTSLRNWHGPWVAAVLTAIIFGAVHGLSAPAVDLLPLALLGFGLCLLYRATGSLYPCIAAHCLNNAIAFGALEGWSWSVVLGLLAGALSMIWLLMQLGKRLGLIRTPPPSAAAGALAQ